MLPPGSLNELYYPMTADVYYSTQKQNDFGEIERSWQKDRTIKCSAIKERPDSKIRPALHSEKFLEYDFRINMRTDSDVQTSSDDIVYPVTEILISNIRDSLGNPVWNEIKNKETNFEIEAIEPMFNELHNLNGYRMLIARSDRQVKTNV